jgi:hypothetical protein
MQNQYSDLYKTLSDVKLLEIIHNPGDYNELAVETAKFELNSRARSSEDLESAKSIFESRIEQKKKEEQNSFITEINDLVKVINPSEERTPEQSLKLLCLVLFCLMIYRLITKFQFLKDFFAGSYEPDFFIIISVIPFFILPIGIYLTWLKRKTGQILLFIYFAYTAFVSATVIKNFIFSLFLDVNPYYQPNLVIEIPTLLFCLAVMYFINTKSIRELFIKPQNQVRS